MNGSARSGQAARWTGVLVLLGTFALYVRTLAPTVYGLDSAELTTGAWCLGIVHSPGSPLFLLLGNLFSRIPLGDVGWRVNLLSAAAGAAGALAVYAAARRLTGRTWIGAAAAALMALSYYVWVWAVVAELYALHLAITAALLALVLKWRDEKKDYLLWAAGLLAGLGLGNHTGLVLTGPGLAWLVLSAEPGLWRRPGRLLGPTAAAIAAAVAVFLYLPLRHAANPPVDFVRDYFPEKDLFSLKGWFWMIRGGMFESLFFGVPARDMAARAAALGSQFLANYGPLACFIALAGLAATWAEERDRRQLAVGLLLLLGFHSGFYLTYAALDSGWMHSVGYLIAALFFALGLRAFERRLLPRPALAALTALLLVRQGGLTFPLADLSEDVSARATGEGILRALEPRGVFVGLWEHTPLLEYLQVVEGRRPDVRLVNAVFLGREGAEAEAAAALARNRPVYTTATALFGPAFTAEPVPGGFCYRVLAADPVPPDG